MKPLALLLIILSLCFATYAQNGPAIAFELRATNPEISNFNGQTRSRTVANENGPSSAEAGRLEREVFDLLNAERRRQGLTDLTWSEDVAGVARMHSADMAKVRFFSHRGSDGSMVDDRADKFGLGLWNVIGENIAYMRGYENPAALAIEKWMESTAHRKNLLGPNWRESAVGVSITDDGTYYMTQVFLLRK